LVATVALGMGFDKPDLGFVIHFQRPASVVSYYQQIGRAGRAIDKAYCILLCGKEDDKISNYFINTAFPPENHIQSIIKALSDSSGGLSLNELLQKLNISYGQVEKALKFLSSESPSPIVKIDKKWRLTPYAESYKIDNNHIENITNLRKEEQREMQEYMDYHGCLMSFLRKSLSDNNIENCGKCKNCDPKMQIDEKFDIEEYNDAVNFLNSSYIPIDPKKRWPQKDILKKDYLIEGMKISENLMNEEGRALCLWQDSGWGNIVSKGKYIDNKFSDELVQACKKMFNDWFKDFNINSIPTWITYIPSSSLYHMNLVADFASRLAKELNLKFVPCIDKTSQNKQQKEMENSYFKVKNLCGVFKINEKCINNCIKEPCLLIDDVIDSGWTLAVAGALLRKSGCSKVYPMALASNYLN
jgi:ATP-dependent DNA helicase RecQ